MNSGILEMTRDAAARSVNTGWTEDIRIGVNPSQLRCFKELNDKVWIYKTALTQQERQGIANP